MPVYYFFVPMDFMCKLYGDIVMRCFTVYLYLPPVTHGFQMDRREWVGVTRENLHDARRVWAGLSTRNS